MVILKWQLAPLLQRTWQSKSKHSSKTCSTHCRPSLSLTRTITSNLLKILSRKCPFCPFVLFQKSSWPIIDEYHPFQIDIPAPQSRHDHDAPVSSASISVTFKSLKPAYSFILSVHPTETISDIKTKLASQANSPPANAQRLLLKGKALADAKLLKEYNIQDGDTINLMVRPGFQWDPTQRSSSASLLEVDNGILRSATEHTPARGHHRIPSVVLTPSHSPKSEKPLDITLTLDTLSTASISEEELSTFHSTIARPLFWKHFREFLRCVCSCGEEKKRGY